MQHSSSLFDLSGRKAIVTGGATGIGQSCALALARAGADVAIADRNAEMGDETVGSIRALGRDSIFVACDVSQSDQVNAMVDSVVERFGRLDILLNNAGIFVPGADDGYAKNDWDRVLAINLTGTWLCACAAMRHMSKQSPPGGKIINIGSLGAHIACSNGAYDASKAGVVQLTRTLAGRWGGYNINVNSVSPGYVGKVFGQSRSAESRQVLRDRTPLGYVQRMKDLHGPILFFASSASDFVTGQDLIVDGGHTLGTWIIPLERRVPPRIDAAGELAE